MGTAGWKNIGLIAGCAAAAWAMRDYARWRSLGPGGLPATWAGWFTTTRLRLRATDPFDVGPIEASAIDDWCAWQDVRKRAGTRPRISPYPVPHHQLDQLPCEPVPVALREIFDRAVAANAREVHYALSYWEKRHPAIRRRSTGLVGAPSFGEIAHIRK